MLHFDLSRPPATPSTAWLVQFAQRLRELDPHYSRAEATAQALCAHAHTWLLGAAEAASLWHCALHGRQHDV